MNPVAHTAKQACDIQEINVVIGGFRVTCLEGALHEGVELFHLCLLVSKGWGLADFNFLRVFNPPYTASTHRTQSAHTLAAQPASTNTVPS